MTSQCALSKMVSSSQPFFPKALLELTHVVCLGQILHLSLAFWWHEVFDGWRLPCFDLRAPLASPFCLSFRSAQSRQSLPWSDEASATHQESTPALRSWSGPKLWTWAALRSGPWSRSCAAISTIQGSDENCFQWSTLSPKLFSPIWSQLVDPSGLMTVVVQKLGGTWGWDVSKEILKNYLLNEWASEEKISSMTPVPPLQQQNNWCLTMTKPNKPNLKLNKSQGFSPRKVTNKAWTKESENHDDLCNLEKIHLLLGHPLNSLWTLTIFSCPLLIWAPVWLASFWVKENQLYKPVGHPCSDLNDYCSKATRIEAISNAKSLLLEPRTKSASFSQGLCWDPGQAKSNQAPRTTHQRSPWTKHTNDSEAQHDDTGSAPLKSKMRHYVCLQGSVNNTVHYAHSFFACCKKMKTKWGTHMTTSIGTMVEADDPSPLHSYFLASEMWKGLPQHCLSWHLVWSGARSWQIASGVHCRPSLPNSPASERMETQIFRRNLAPLPVARATWYAKCCSGFFLSFQTVGWGDCGRGGGGWSKQANDKSF